MTAQAQPTINYLDVIERLPENGTLVLRGLSWEEYEELLEAVGEARGLRISYGEGTVQIMSVSFEHEYYAEFLKQLVGRICVILRIKVIFFGSATLKLQKKLKGAEPDGSFYVHSAATIGNKIHLDLNTDPPPDVIIEIDIHHESLSRFPIYAALGIPEIWHYDERQLTIYQLAGSKYSPTAASPAFPVLTSAILTEFLLRSQSDDQYETLVVCEQWLQSQSA